MIKSYKILKSGLKRIETGSANWVHLDQGKLMDYDSVKKYKIKKADFKAAIDKYERARILRRENYIMIILNLPSSETNVSMGIYLFKDKIITIHEKSCKFLTSIINHPENISSVNTLFIRLIKEVTNTYIKRINELEDQILNLEEKVNRSTSKKNLNNIFKLRKQLVFMIKGVAGNRDVITNIQNTSRIIALNKMQTIELNELHTEHMQIYDTMTIFREILSNSLEIYNSNLSIEMNRIIQRLTIVGSFILLPTLIASIYGMNFRPEASIYNMPELTWKYGYLFSLVLMMLSVFVTYTYLKKKKLF